MVIIIKEAENHLQWVSPCLLSKIRDQFGKWFHHFRATVFPIYRNCCFGADIKTTSGVECLRLDIYLLCGVAPEENANIRDSLQQFNQKEVCSTMTTFLMLTAILLKISALFAPTEGNW